MNPLVGWAGIVISCSHNHVHSTGASIWQQLSGPWSPVAAALYLAPLLAALAVFESQAGRFPAVAEIRQLLRVSLLPILRGLPLAVRAKCADSTL